MLVVMVQAFALGSDTLKSPFPFHQAEISYHSGMIMPHVPSIDFLSQEYTTGIDLRLIRHTDGSKPWHRHYHRPLLGIGYHGGSLGNQRIYGQAHSLYGFFEAPLWNLSRSLYLNYQMSAGLSYINRTFDLDKNIYNIAIGTHLNLHYQLSVLAGFRLTPKYHVVAGLGLTHFSNGKIHSPNKGLNLISTTVGIRYRFNDQPSQQPRNGGIPGNNPASTSPSAQTAKEKSTNKGKNKTKENLNAEEQGTTEETSNTKEVSTPTKGPGGKERQIPSKSQNAKDHDKNHFSLVWSHGLKDHNRFHPAVYYVSSLNFNYERQYAPVAKFGVGLDAFYNPSLKHHQDNKRQGSDLTNPTLYRMGVHLSHDIQVGDFSLTLQLGHYLYNRVFYITDFYNRVGLKYYSSPHLMWKLSLKSHNANAEFIELGFGYHW